MSTAETVQVRRDRELAEYLTAMERDGSDDIFTADFLDGFRHALAMVAAYESGEQPSPDRAKPEVREAARLVLSRMNNGGDRG
jgi:hypothetical protein